MHVYVYMYNIKPSFYCLREGLMLEIFIEDCLWEDQENSEMNPWLEEEEASETIYDEPTTSPFSCPPAPRVRRR